MSYRRVWLEMSDYCRKTYANIDGKNIEGVKHE